MMLLKTHDKNTYPMIKQYIIILIVQIEVE